MTTMKAKVQLRRTSRSDAEIRPLSVSSTNRLSLDGAEPMFDQKIPQNHRNSSAESGIGSSLTIRDSISSIDFDCTELEGKQTSSVSVGNKLQDKGKLPEIKCEDREGLMINVTSTIDEDTNSPTSIPYSVVGMETIPSTSSINQGKSTPPPSRYYGQSYQNVTRQEVPVRVTYSCDYNNVETRRRSSEFSLTRSGSVDSAIDVGMPNTYGRRKSTISRPSSIAIIVENDDRLSVEVPTPSPRVINEKDTNLDVTVEQICDVTQLSQDGSSSLAQHTEHSTTETKTISRTVKYIRFILSIVSTCIPKTTVRSEGARATFTNHAYSEDDPALYQLPVINSDERKESYIKPSIHDLTLEKNDFLPEITSDERKQSYIKPSIHDLTLEKNDFLKSFDLMSQQAKRKGVDIVGHIFQIGNFSAAILDSRGGCLSVDTLDVRLYVPPGAIPVGERQTIYIFVAGSSTNTYNFLTPFVHCGPSDFVFMKDVILTFPHCIKEASNCQFTCSKLSSRGLQELQEGSDVIVDWDEESVTMVTDHFCGFGATASPLRGTILTKFMIACVFICADNHCHDEVIIRVRLVDDTKTNCQVGLLLLFVVMVLVQVLVLASVQNKNSNSIITDLSILTL